jgi:uncharacterized protein (DUF433 family)/DNA-binding transcriptional MerR regulator
MRVRRGAALAAANYAHAVSDVVLMPPRGHYLASEVGQLAGVSGETIGQWARYGYIRSSQSEPGEYPRVYSYQDVAEAILVHELIEKAVPLKGLRPVIEELRNELGDWPLQRAELKTVTGGRHDAKLGEEIPVAALLRRSPSGLSELGPRGWQEVGDVLVNPQRVVADLHRGGWAVRELPNLRHIEVDPDRLSGRPAIRGRRVPASLVAELAGEPDGLDILHEDYELDDDQISDASAWWRVTSGFEKVAA